MNVISGGQNDDGGLTLYTITGGGDDYRDDDGNPC